MYQTIQDYCGVPPSWPVIEMKQPLLITVNKGDLKGAKQGDCRACVFAKAASRFGAGGHAAFFSEIGYLPLWDKKGRGYLGKFSLPKAMRSAIKTFDETGEFPTERGFELAPLYQSKQAHVRRITGKLASQTSSGERKVRGPSKPHTGRRSSAPAIIAHAQRLLPA